MGATGHAIVTLLHGHVYTHVVLHVKACQAVSGLASMWPKSVQAACEVAVQQWQMTDKQ